VNEDFEVRSGLEVLVFSPLDGVDAVVTTRAGGVSTAPYDTLNLADHVGDDRVRVAENRARLAEAMGVCDDDLVFARQTHGVDVANVERGGQSAEADVLVTADPDLALCILVADCVPLLVCDPEAQVLALAHAGWRGTAAGAAGAAVRAALDLGADADRLVALVGPRISAEAYQVGPEVEAALREAGDADAVRPDGSGRFLADLGRANARQLATAGVAAERIFVSSEATDGGRRFFSDRAQRPCGRFALSARLRAGAS